MFSKFQKPFFFMNFIFDWKHVQHFSFQQVHQQTKYFHQCIHMKCFYFATCIPSLYSLLGWKICPCIRKRKRRNENTTQHRISCSSRVVEYASIEIFLSRPEIWETKRKKNRKIVEKIGRKEKKEKKNILCGNRWMVKSERKC
jgi:hypothetical protein